MADPPILQRNPRKSRSPSNICLPPLSLILELTLSVSAQASAISVSLTPAVDRCATSDRLCWLRRCPHLSPVGAGACASPLSSMVFNGCCLNSSSSLFVFACLVFYFFILFYFLTCCLGFYFGEPWVCKCVYCLLFYFVLVLNFFCLNVIIFILCLRIKGKFLFSLTFDYVSFEV